MPYNHASNVTHKNIMRVLVTRIFLLFLFSSSLLVSGCGFHLRGQIDVPESLMRMHVKGTDIELVNDVERSLKFSSIELVAEGDNAALLDLSNTTYVRDVIGTTSGGIATSYKFTYRVNYVVYDADGEVLQADNVMQNRTLAYDPSQVLLFEREEIFLKEDMRKSLVSFILRRMSKIQ
jgi:LPS-assembly lipoprotein